MMVQEIKGKMEARIKKCIEYDFLYGDADSFMKHFDMDEVSKFHTKKWFEGYALVFERPINCYVQVGSSFISSNKQLEGVIKINLDYRTYDSECLLLYFILDIKKDIIVQSKFTVQNAIDSKLYGIKELCLNMTGRVLEEYMDLKDLKEAEDPLEPQMYARILIKSMRYRMSNVEINSAALLSESMCYNTIKLAEQLKNISLKESFYTLNNYAKKYLVAKSDCHDDEKEPTSPKEQALISMKSLDDIYYEIKRKGKSGVNCLENISFYLSILQLVGTKIKDYFVIVQPFHFMALVRIEDHIFLISFNEVISMTKTRIYGDASVRSIFNPIWFYNPDMESTNMSHKEVNLLKTFFEKVPIFPIALLPDEKCEIEKNDEMLPCFKEYESAQELHRNIKRYVFEKSRIQPFSIYTWAKYGYQSIYVKKPQAFVISGLLSKKVQHFLGEITSASELIQWIKISLEKGSIFPEKDRIMTAEQVLIHRTASEKDLALFFYTILIAGKIIETGGVVITSDTSYVMGLSGEIANIWNINDFTEDRPISGQVMMAFNEKSSYNYYFDSVERLKELNWYEEINKR